MGPDIPVPSLSEDGLRLDNCKEPKILLAGLGNFLLRDDGVGVHAILELQKGPLPGVQVVEVGTAVLDALHLFEWADRILAIDAMHGGGPPGAIYLFPDFEAEDRTPKASLHEMDLLAALRLVPERKRHEIMVLGVEPKIIEFGLELSPEIQRVLPQVIRLSRQIISQWSLMPPPREKQAWG
jgi:hydrogenase maturation protease